MLMLVLVLLLVGLLKWQKLRIHLRLGNLVVLLRGCLVLVLLQVAVAQDRSVLIVNCRVLVGGTQLSLVLLLLLLLLLEIVLKLPLLLGRVKGDRLL